MPEHLAGATTTLKNTLLIPDKINLPGDWDEAMNILCIRLDSMGDVLMTTPAMRALKEARTGRRISLFASPSGAEVAALVPEVDDVLVYEAPWMKATEARTDSAPEYAMIDRLRSHHFDAAVIFTVYSQNPLPAAFLCYMAGIPLRLAYCHENTYQMLTHWVPDPEPDKGIRHEVRRHLDLVAMIGGQSLNERMSIRIPSGAVERVVQRMHASGIDIDKPWLIVHTGATAASRRYPPEGFAEAARLLTLEHGFQAVFTGSGSEDTVVEYIRGLMRVPSFSLVNRLDLGELVALIAMAPILLSNNTGPVHIAAATGTPVVDLYALTNPQHTPWAVPQRVLSYDVPCKYCYKSICQEGHHNCLRMIRPAEVAQAVVDLYRETQTLAGSAKIEEILR